MAGGMVTVSSVPAMNGAVLVLTGAMADAPDAVTDLLATGGSSVVDLTWSAASGATDYDIYRSLVTGGGYSFVGSTSCGNYSDTTVTNATRYYYVVVSHNFCSIEAGMQTAGGLGNKLVLLGWHIDKGNRVELILKEERDKIILKQWAGGDLVRKQSAKVAIAPNTTYDVRIVSQFDVFIDSTQVMSVVPGGAVLTGTVGFQARNTVGMFSFINVQ